jgi:hypothetical protein
MIKEELLKTIEALLKEYAAEVDTVGPQEESLIASAEAFLGVTFPPSYREFVRRWGALGFGPEEVYGVTSDHFERSSVPNGIWFTAQSRSDSGLPLGLLVVVNDNGERFYCIDTSQKDARGESPIVIWDVSARSIVGTKSPSFGDFLLERIQETAEIIDAD